MAEVVENFLRPSRHSNSLTARGTSDGVGSPQLAHFHRFPDLPPELRDMILQACLPRRLFKFSYWQPRSPDKPPSDLSEKPSALPSIAFVCKDAYNISKMFVREYHVSVINMVSVQTAIIRFDPDLDTLFVNFRGLTDDEEPEVEDLEREREIHLQNLHNGPYALAMMPKVNIMLGMVGLVGPRRRVSQTRWLTTRPYSDCLARHGHCTVKLATTSFSTTSTEIRSSGLFGMFGEERHILIDIKDTAKIDQYESYVDQLESAGGTRSRGWNYFPENEPAHCILSAGAGRYGTRYEARTKSDAVYVEDYEDARALSTVSSSIAEEDGTMALYLIKQAWLEANHCFEPAEDPLLPWTGDERFRKWDDEHHVAKHWLSKLPTFSFVVMYMVTERKDTVSDYDSE
ncbi:hypothetical protein LA080_000152 [Diaporthe eres]|nr:hypothetical protein LA080_000152 [Diaporthe eres]